MKRKRKPRHQYTVHFGANDALADRKVLSLANDYMWIGDEVGPCFGWIDNPRTLCAIHKRLGVIIAKRDKQQPARALRRGRAG